MHPKKREMLDLVATSAEHYDRAMHNAVGVALRPHVHGLRKSLLAAVPLPFMGFGAICLGITYLAASKSKDRIWERAYPTGRDVTDLAK